MARLRPRRGEIYLVNFDPTVGSEIRKTRLGLVIQNDVANRHSPITIVAAMTTKFDARAYPTEVPVPARRGGPSKDSVILLNQIRSIDRERLVKRLGRVDDVTLGRVDRAIKISLGLVEL